MLVDTVAKHVDAIAQLEQRYALVVDVETNGLDAFGVNQICSMPFHSNREFQHRHENRNRALLRPVSNQTVEEQKFAAFIDFDSTMS